MLTPRSGLPGVLMLLALGAAGQSAVTSAPRAVEVAGADALEANAADGRAVFEQWCLACHGAGPGHPGTMALAARRGEAQAVLLERDDLPADYVKAVVRNGFQMMPPLRSVEISAAELQALAAYVASGGGRR